MSKTKIKNKENILERILSSLDSTWAKLTIIGAIGFVGFKAGCYYQETIMTRKQNAEYQQQTDAWVQKEEYYRDKIQELRLKVVELEKKFQTIKRNNNMANKKEIESFESLVSQLRDSIAANTSEEQMRELVSKFEEKIVIQKKAYKGFNTMLFLLLFIFVSLCVGLFLVLDRNDSLEQKISNMEYRDSLFNQIMQPDSNSTVVYRVRNGVPVTYSQLANESDSLLQLTHDIESAKETYRIKLGLVTRNYPVSFTDRDGIISIHAAKIDSALLLLPLYRDKISYDPKQKTWSVTRTDYKVSKTSSRIEH